MRLVTAHKILIGSGVVFFLFFGANRFLAYQGSGDPGALTAAIGGALASLGLIAYYRTIGVRR